MNRHEILGLIPKSLRNPLIEEYQSIVNCYSQSRWLPTELSGGRFCEIVCSIIQGFANGSYPTAPMKPQNFVGACRRLEQNKHVPRSLQILIPRLLPAIFEVRNNRGVGHVGGDVNSNQMDAVFIVYSCSWVMSELVRIFHNVSVQDAQTIVDSLSQRRIPLIWEGQSSRRVLQPNLNIQSQILLLVATSTEPVPIKTLLNWIEYKNVRYFKRLLQKMHSQRLVELSEDSKLVQVLPPGAKKAEDIIRKNTNHT